MTLTLTCKTCANELARNAVTAFLIPGRNIRLYSSLEIENRNIIIYRKNSRAYSCKCMLRQLYCKKCVKCIGYCVVDICDGCGDNNGHRFMFGMEEVDGRNKILAEELWINLFIRNNYQYLSIIVL